MNVQQKMLLQVSRGIAAFLVLLFHVSAMSFKYFHYNFLGVSNLGRSGGVDYFFVLTGFLLYTIYGSKMGVGKNILSFIWNRLLRIYPFYWLITLVVLPVYFLVPSFGYGYETNRDTIIHSLLLLPQTHGPIVPVAWSLSYFVLFYALFSLLMALGRRASYVLASIWLLLTLCNVCHVPVISTDIGRHVYLNFLFNEVNVEFAVGCLIAYWTKTHRFKYPHACLITGCIGFLLIWLNNEFLLVPFHDYIMYDIPAAVVLVSLVSLPEKRSNPQWLLALSKLGDASYTILLTHLLFISILMKITKATHVANKIGFLSDDVLVVLMTLPLSFLVYKLVEKPLVSRLKAFQYPLWAV
jgi:exopolysaccharide production protein ExoZ